MVGVDGDDGQARALPEVLMLDLGHGHVEPVAELGLQAAQSLALVLQGAGAGEMQVEGEQSDDHGPILGPGR